MAGTAETSRTEAIFGIYCTRLKYEIEVRMRCEALRCQESSYNVGPKVSLPALLPRSHGMKPILL